MYLFALGILSTILLYCSWELIKEYNLNKYGFIMVVITTAGLFGVISFIGAAYAEGEPTGAFRAGAAGLLLIIILGVITFRVLKIKSKSKKVTPSSNVENI